MGQDDGFELVCGYFELPVFTVRIASSSLKGTAIDKNGVSVNFDYMFRAGDFFRGTERIQGYAHKKRIDRLVLFRKVNQWYNGFLEVFFVYKRNQTCA